MTYVWLTRVKLMKLEKAAFETHTAHVKLTEAFLKMANATENSDYSLLWSLAAESAVWQTFNKHRHLSDAIKLSRRLTTHSSCTSVHSIQIHIMLKENGRITLKHLKGHLWLHMCEVFHLCASLHDRKCMPVSCGLFTYMVHITLLGPSLHC